jgi:hypothetical protein
LCIASLVGIGGLAYPPANIIVTEAAPIFGFSKAGDLLLLRAGAIDLFWSPGNVGADVAQEALFNSPAYLMAIKVPGLARNPSVA